MSMSTSALVGTNIVGGAVAGYSYSRALGAQLGSHLPHVDLGNLATWFAAFGSVLAAVVALKIATGDRRERRRERLAAAEAQAKLVMVRISAARDDDDSTIYVVDVENFGTQPVLDLSMRSASMGARNDARAVLADTTLDIVPPGKNLSLGRVLRFVTLAGEIVPKPIEISSHGMIFQSWPNAGSQGIECWVQYADAHGNRWAKSSEHRLLRL